MGKKKTYRPKKKRGNYRFLSWIKREKMHRILLVFSSCFLLFLILFITPFLIASDASAFGKFPEKTYISGVDVSCLSREEAKEKCINAMKEFASKPFSLKIDNEEYSQKPEELSLEIDYDRMIENAYKRAWSVNIFERMVRRLLKKPKAMNMPIFQKCDENALEEFVRRALPSINCRPRDAYMDVSSGQAKIVPARDGRKANFEKVLLAAKKAITAGKRGVKVPVDERIPPKVKSVNIGKFILVNLGEHTLSLYDNEKLLAKYPVCTGSPEWPTCIGEWAVVKAEKNPTWYNRGSTWAEKMPPMLPPGPGNPLGTRAITINGGGVLIHGTTDTWSIGKSVSHGCIRMYMRDVEELFEHVYIGMPVYIIRKSGDPGFDCSKKAWWKK